MICKYLKYKNKYLQNKIIKGGAITLSPRDHEELEVSTPTYDLRFMSEVVGQFIITDTLAQVLLRG
jgi:hypothetical protein